MNDCSYGSGSLALGRSRRAEIHAGSFDDADRKNPGGAAFSQAATRKAKQMETFIEQRAFMANPDFQKQKRKALSRLASERIDRPLANLVRRLNGLPHCFTLQCCFGHFVYDGQNDVHNLEPLPTDRDIDIVEYRIAYVALCVEASGRGRNLLEGLKKVVKVDPENVQFGCAGWFWERQVNSYVMQVEPRRFQNADTASLDFKEALRIEKTRNAFFDWLDA